MANVTFSGTVSAQIAAGETVTIVVTLPDGSKDTLTAITTATLTFTITKQYAVAGAYSAIASIAADTGYTSASSAAVPFTITLATRTVTLNVSLA